jgi:hypothetical protein
MQARVASALAAPRMASVSLSSTAAETVTAASVVDAIADLKALVATLQSQVVTLSAAVSTLSSASASSTSM